MRDREVTSALIFGRAQGVWDEIAQARDLGNYSLTIAVGSAGVDYPNWIDAWVSFHESLFPRWIELRAKAGRNIPKALWSSSYKGSLIHGRQPVAEYPVRQVPCEGGSSGLIAVVVALEIYCVNYVVLAGIPMEEGRGQYDTGQPWREAITHRPPWQQRYEQMKDRVRSMSGWTQQLLGAPTKEWLQPQTQAA